MKYVKTCCALVTALMLSPSAFAQEKCVDDDRLYQLSTFVEQAKSGSVEPLKLTARTYLNLTPGAREALGNNIHILDNSCEPMEVLDGQPPVKMEFPFHEIYTSLYDAVLRGDETTTNLILTSFKAAPTDTAGFASLLGVVSDNNAINRRLAEAVGMAVHTTETIKSCRPHPGHVEYVLFSEIFSRLGGKVENPNGRGWIIIDKDGETYFPELPARIEPTAGNSCGLSIEALHPAAADANMIVVKPKFIGNSPEKWNERYNKWLEMGAPDDAPKSLFE